MLQNQAAQIQLLKYKYLFRPDPVLTDEHQQQNSNSNSKYSLVTVGMTVTPLPGMRQFSSDRQSAPLDLTPDGPVAKA